MLRCAQSPRSNVLVKYASARQFFARLASQIFLSSLQTQLQPFFTKHWLREPLVHFLLIGLALFVVYCLLNPVPGDRYDANRIELTGDNLRQMTIEWLAQGHPPSTPKQMVTLDGRFPTEVIKP
jgi:hypothetical protein